MNRGLSITALVVSLLALVLSITALGKEPVKETRVVEREAASSETTTASDHQKDAPAKAQKPIPGDGMYLIGKDVQPGTYRAEDTEACAVTMLGESLEDERNFDLYDGPAVIEVSEDDMALRLQDCPVFKPE